MSNEDIVVCVGCTGKSPWNILSYITAGWGARSATGHNAKKREETYATSAASLLPQLVQQSGRHGC